MTAVFADRSIISMMLVNDSYISCQFCGVELQIKITEGLEGCNVASTSAVGG